MPARLCILALSAALLAALVVASAHGDRSPVRRVVGYGQIRFAGLGPERWAQRFRREHRAVARLRAELRQLRHQVRRDRRVLLARPSVREAIDLAAATYGHGSELWRKADCESGLSPTAANASGASGLFQFLPSTFRSTPYGSLSIWSPYANALAAGWMHAHGRGGEWVCQ